MDVEPFTDRRAAGRELGRLLAAYAGREGLAVLGLPRGGVPVAYEVARTLGAPLDVFVVRKLGVPGHEELAMGAIASGGVQVVNEDVLAAAGVGRAGLDAVTVRERGELARRERAYRGERGALALAGRVALVVDDGLATGATMRAAIAALRRRDVAATVVAVPVAAPEICAELARHADELVCALAPRPFVAVGAWYEDFDATSDAEVRSLLDAAARERRPPARHG